MPATGFYGWKLLAVFWFILVVNLAFPAYGSSVVNAYMASDLQLDRKTLGLLFSVYMLMGGLPGPLVALCVNKIGSRITLVLGSLLLLAGALLMALVVNTGLQAVVVFGVIIGTSTLTGGALAAQTSVTAWFIRRRALALSIMLTASGIGGFVAAPLLNYVIASSGNNWRMGWWVIAGLACLSTLAAVLFVKDKPADVGQQPDGDPAAAASAGKARTGAGVHITAETWTFRGSLRSSSLWLIMFGALGMSAGFTLFMAHGVVHLKDLGHSPAIAALAISIMVFANLIGKVTFGMLGDRIEPRYLWAVAALFFAVGMLLVVSARTVFDIYIFAICLGFGFGTMVACLMTVLSNYYGTGAYASIVGLAMAIQTTVSAIAPLVGGYMYDTYGSYGSTFYATSVLCFAGAVLVLFARPPRRADLWSLNLKPWLLFGKGHAD